MIQKVVGDPAIFECRIMFFFEIGANEHLVLRTVGDGRLGSGGNSVLPPSSTSINLSPTRLNSRVVSILPPPLGLSAISARSGAGSWPSVLGPCPRSGARAVSVVDGLSVSRSSTVVHLGLGVR